MRDPIRLPSAELVTATMSCVGQRFQFSRRFWAGALETRLIAACTSLHGRVILVLPHNLSPQGHFKIHPHAVGAFAKLQLLRRLISLCPAQASIRNHLLASVFQFILQIVDIWKIHNNGHPVVVSSKSAAAGSGGRGLGVASTFTSSAPGRRRLRTASDIVGAARQREIAALRVHPWSGGAHTTSHNGSVLFPPLNFYPLAKTERRRVHWLS